MFEISERHGRCREFIDQSDADVYFYSAKYLNRNLHGHLNQKGEVKNLRPIINPKKSISLLS